MAVVQKCVNANDLGNSSITVNGGGGFSYRDNDKALTAPTTTVIDAKYDTRFDEVTYYTTTGPSGLP
jgi:hypothetical protein